MNIGKREFNKLLKSLDIILNLKNRHFEKSMFYIPSDPPLKHSLTTDNINQFFSENSDLSEFEILKELLTEVINLNPNNNSGLFSIYRLLAEKAKFEGNTLYTDYAKKAFKYYALRQLSGWRNSNGESLYLQVICRKQDLCNKCQHLDNMIYSENDFIRVLPIPVEKCTNEYLCPSALSVMSERLYFKLKEENKLF
ncbi:MAG TPA: hypothetical protein VL125_02505 [Pelobium sp.]|nr:hypothetical protein [Pelobium sp.]